MKTQRTIIAAALLLLGGLAMASAQGTMFTYQGRLNNGVNPANGSYDLRFTLYTADVGGSQRGPILTHPATAVSNGLFTVQLDFGEVFPGADRWLDLGVRTNGGGTFTTLSPRQQLTPTPYAIYSGTAGTVPSGAIGSAQLANNISLGTTTNNGRLDVYRTAANTPAISLIGAGSLINAYGDDGLTKARTEAASYGGRLTTWDELGIETAHVGSSLDAGGVLWLYQPNGNVGVTLDGASSQINSYGNGGQLRAQVESGSYGGRLTTWDELGNETAHVGSATDAGGVLWLYQKNGNLGVNLDGDSTGTSGGGSLGVHASDGSTAVLLNGSSGAGNVSVRNTSGGSRVALSGQSTGGGGGVFVYDNSGTSTLELTGAETSTTGSQLLMKQANGTNTIQLDAEFNAGGGGLLRLYKGDGTLGITLRADLNGESKITTQVLQITGGADLSEQFEIKAANETPQPGMIVCIDPETPGQLVTSSKAYDRTVAGVMSGAGGVKPGMLMGQQGTAADGKHPVALTGRVYCEADASNGPIHPGDLLTTSNTPGHAMKVTDYPKAQGAIIGKAMSALDKGQGLVLVLVSLQ